MRSDVPLVVEGPDEDSANHVLAMAQRMREILANYFPWPEHPPGPIEIHLIPAASANFTGAYVVNTDANGRSVALVRWGPDAKFSDTCLALGGVMLKNLVVWNNGAAFNDKVPDWLALALGKMLEVNLKPSVVESLARQASELPVLSLRQITTAHGPLNESEQQVLVVNGFWLARYLDQKCAKPALAAALFSTLSVGANPGTTITTAFPDNFDNVRDLEMWWQVGYRDLTRRLVGPVQSMADSRAALDRLEFVDLPTKDGAPKRTRLADAWAGRMDSTVRDALAAEVVGGPAMLLQINPAYRNAAISLLSALGKLHGDVEKDFRNAWDRYLTDRADAESYEATVEAALQGN